MKKLGLTIAAASLLVALAGCSGSGSGGSGTTIQVTAKSMNFEPKTVTVKKGQPVKLVFANQDEVEHDLSVDKISLTNMKAQDGGHDMKGKMPDLHVSADTGKTGTLEFTATEAGTYELYCTVDTHKQKGMVGKLVVE